MSSGFVRTLCGPALCGAKTLTVYRRTILRGNHLDVTAGNDYHLLYIIDAPAAGVIRFRGETRAAERGAGALLAPGESARVEAPGAELEALHVVVPRPPAAIEQGLSGGPGYVFDRGSLRTLQDASGGRVRRFCAESSVRLRNGDRLTPTNAIQAGEMHYNEGGSSPYHAHFGTPSNPGGADHCYMTFQGRGRVDVENDSIEIEPGTLVYFPPGVPHRLSAVGGPLDYFEIQAWRSFKTSILSEEPLGLRWYYERVPGEPLEEWNQT